MRLYRCPGWCLLLGLLWVLGTLGACGSHQHAEDEPAEIEDPRPDQSITLYQNGLELFMEWPSFVVGQESPLIAHFTDVRDPEGFQWVTSGRVTATLRYADGLEQSFVADKLLRNGIFKPVVLPSRAGMAELTLRLEGSVAGEVSVGSVQVFADLAGALAAAEDEEPGEPTVSYLKESQWKTRYATDLAVRRTLRGSVRATGELMARAEGRAKLGSPMDGRLQATPLLRLGAPVRAGDILGRVVGLGAEDLPALEAQLAQVEVELSLAEQALTRTQSLVPAVLSQKDLEQAQAAVQLAQRRQRALEARRRSWSGGGSTGAELRSPITGTVAFVYAQTGSALLAGEAVVEVVNSERLWLSVQVAELHADQVRGSAGAMFRVPGREGWVLVDGSSGGEILALGPAIHPITRTVPMLLELNNPGDLWPGAFVEVQVFTEERRDVVAVPASAVVDDGGFPVVYVMEGGESFFKRRVQLGLRDGDWVELLSGVEEGERVVSRGAYEVLLSTSAGGIPAHGHQH